MPTSYTSLLGLALPVTGELSGTWGDTVNDYITQYLDAAVAGAQTIGGSQTAVTLSKTTASSLTQAGSGSTGSSQYQIINCTGNPAGLLTITAPAASKVYLVLNSTSTSQSVKVVGAGPTTGVTMVSGEKALIAWDGSDFVKVASSVADGVTTISFGTTGLTPSTATSGAVTVAGTLGAGNGGTGRTSLTLNNVILGNGTSAVQFVAPGTTGNVLTSNGTTWTSAVLPAGGLTYVYKNSNYTVADKEGVLADTSAGAFTVTLPASPATGAQVVVADAGAAWGTNNLTVGRNGSTIGGLAENLVCDITGASVQLVYDGSTWEVYAQIGGNGGNAATQPGNNAFTGANTFYNSTGQTFGTGTSTQDGIILAGRAGGSSSYRVTLTPTTLTASRTVTLPDANTTIPVATQVLTFSGPTAARTYTLPDETCSVGFLNIPQNAQTGSYTLVLADAGKHIYRGSGTAATWTIPANSSVAYPIGTALTFINYSSTSVSIAITSDTMRLSSAGTTGTRTLAQYGSATAIKVDSTNWIISGSGLT
jgi:hypothetical protein